MNKCIFLGNLVKDFEVRYGNNGLAVARAALALNRGKDKDGNDRGADYINLVAFGKTAEFFEKYGTKGRRFLLEAHVQTGSYEKDGNKVYTTDFVVDHAEFADSKPDNAKADSNNSDGFSVDYDMDIPFASPTR